MHAWLRCAVVAGSAALGCLAWPVTADACVCVGYPSYTAEQVRHDIESGLDRAAAVFTGETISADNLVAVLRVEKVWKGEIGSEVRMRHATPKPDGTVVVLGCDYTFSKGKKYVVFGTRVSADLMYAGRCGSTGLLELSDRTIEILETVAAIRRGREPDAYARFLALERSWMTALAARDLPALERFLAPDFTIIGVGSISQAPVVDRAYWLPHAAQFPWPTHEVRLVKVHERGDMAVVHCVLTATYPPKTVTPEGGELDFLVTDVWIKRGGAWQVLSRHLSLEQ